MSEFWTAYSKEHIRYIHGDKDGQADVRELVRISEAALGPELTHISHVTPEDQVERHDVL